MAGGAAAGHHTANAKRVIYLFQSGGPSQVDLFDYKPQLEKLNGEPMPASLRFMAWLGKTLVMDPLINQIGLWRLRRAWLMPH